MRSGRFALLSLALLACVPSPPVTVVHVAKKEGTSGPDERVFEGLRMRRPERVAFPDARGGAYVVRGTSDWEKIWKGDAPAVPDGVNLQTEMLLAVATDDAIVSKLEIVKAAESGSGVTVWVKQTMLGEGCVHRPEDKAAIDAVVTPRIDKPIRFVVEDEDAPSCGAPPKAEVSCRVGAAKSWTQKIAAKTGDVVECELASVATGKYELIDQVLTLSDLPPASKAKLSFSKGSVRAKLTPDTFGTYAIRAEATDEAGRKGRGTAVIEVAPKKTLDVLLQLTWSDSDAAVDPIAPLPRTLLRVSTEGARGQRCSSEVPVPGLCDAKTRGSYTYMKIPAGRRKLPLSLLYLDERAQAGPSPCVNVWFNGTRTTTICDKDHRHAEDKWELGSLETWTGKIIAPKPPPPPKEKPTPPAAKPAPGAPAPAPAPKPSAPPVPTPKPAPPPAPAPAPKPAAPPAPAPAPAPKPAAPPPPAPAPAPAPKPAAPKPAPAPVEHFTP